VDTHGSVLSPLTLAPVNEVDLVLLPEGLKDLKGVVRAPGLAVSGAGLNLAAGFDRKAKRQCVCKAGLKPNIKENPRNRQKLKRGRKRCFAATLYKLRFIVERPFAWEDKVKNLAASCEASGPPN